MFFLLSNFCFNFNHTYNYIENIMIRIRTDDLLFIISKKSLEHKCPTSKLLKYINTPDNDLLQNLPDEIIGIENETKSFDVTTMYLDIDPIIMKQIIRLLREGNLEQSFSDTNFLHKTLEKLDMLNLISNTNSEIQNNIAKIFGIMQPHETTEIDSFRDSFRDSFMDNKFGDNELNLTSQQQFESIDITKLENLLSGLDENHLNNDYSNNSGNEKSFSEFSTNVIESINNINEINNTNDIADMNNIDGIFNMQNVKNTNTDKQHISHRTKHKHSDKKSKSRSFIVDTETN